MTTMAGNRDVAPPLQIFQMSPDDERKNTAMRREACPLYSPLSATVFAGVRMYVSGYAHARDKQTGTAASAPRDSPIDRISSRWLYDYRIVHIAEAGSCSREHRFKINSEARAPPPPLETTQQVTAAMTVS